MANPYDRFDRKPVNPYDRFDGPKTKRKQRKRTWRDTASALINNFADDAAAFAEGAAAIVDIPTKALGSALSLGARAVGADNVADNLARAQGVGDLIRKVVPQAKNNAIGRGVSSGLGGVASGLGIAAGLPKVSSSPVTVRLADMLKDRPVLQSVGAAGAGVAVEAARAAGAPLPVQLGAGLAAGVVTPAAVDASFNSGKVLLHGFRDRGVREAAARLLQDNAVDTIAAAQRAREARSAVPGVTPTLAEATRDPGLAALQRSLADSSVAGGATVSTRMGENALARGRAADRAFGAGNPQALVTAADRRLAAARSAAEASVERVAPLVPAEVAGREARQGVTMLADAKGVASRNVGRLFEEIDDGEPFRWSGVDPAEVFPGKAPPSADPIDPAAVTRFQDQAVRGARGAPPKRPQSLMQFVRAQGGIRPRMTDPNPTLGGDGRMKMPGVDDLQSAGITSKTAPGLFRNDGKTVEELYQAAIDAGFFMADSDNAPDANDFRRFIQALSDEYAGQPVYRPSDVAAVADYAEAVSNRDNWRRIFDERDLDPVSMKDADWQALYKEIELRKPTSEAVPATLDDIERMPRAGIVLSPYQRVLTELRDRFFGPNGEDAPAEVRRLMADVLAPDEMTPGRLQRLSKRAYDMAARTSDGSQRGYLRAYARALDNIAMRESPEYRRGQLDTARAARRDMAERFEDGPVGDVLTRDRYNRFEMSDAAVPARLVPPGRQGATAADQLNRALDPATAEAVVRGEVRRQIDTVGGERVAARYADTFRRYPALASDVDAVRESEAFLDAFSRSPLGRLAGDGRDPVEAIRQAVDARDGARQLASLARAVGDDAEAMAGLRRALAEVVRSKSARGGMIAQGETAARPTDVPNVAGLRRSLENVLRATAQSRGRGAPILEGDQRRMLLRIVAELRRADYAGKANRTTNSATARNAAVMGRTLQLALRTAAAGKGGPFLDILLQVAHRADDVRALATQAMVDPELAAELLTMRTPQELVEFGQRSRSLYLGGQAGALASAGEPQRLAN